MQIIVGSITVLTEVIVVGTSAVQESTECFAEVRVFPCVNNWIQRGIQHRQREYTFVEHRRCSIKKLEHLCTRDEKVWDPTQRKTSQDKQDHLQ